MTQGFADRPAARVAGTAEGELRVGRHALPAISDGYFAQLPGADERHRLGLESDVDPRVAQQTRDRFVAAMEGDGSLAVGCHFPGLKAGRLLGGEWVDA